GVEYLSRKIFVEPPARETFPAPVVAVVGPAPAETAADIRSALCHALRLRTAGREAERGGADGRRAKSFDDRFHGYLASLQPVPQGPGAHDRPSRRIAQAKPAACDRFSSAVTGAQQFKALYGNNRRLMETTCTDDCRNRGEMAHRSDKIESQL